MKKLFLLFSYCLVSVSSFAEDAPLWLRHSAISPDGQTVTFSYQGDIFTCPVQGGNATQLTSNIAYDAYPVWSPDSKKIAFASRREGSLDVWLVDAHGGAPTRLTTDSGGEIPLAFKDENTVLFQASMMP